MEKINKLENELANKYKEVSRLRDEIEKIKFQEKLPELQKKYESRFWKYRNSTSAEDSWWLYSYCRKVDDEHYGTFDKFETTPYESKFNFKESENFHLCQIEITRDEYMKALVEFKNKLLALAKT